MNGKDDAGHVDRSDIAQSSASAPVHVVQADAQAVHTDGGRHNFPLDHSRHSNSKKFDRSFIHNARASQTGLQRSNTAPDRFLAAYQASETDLGRAPSVASNASQLTHETPVTNPDVPASDVCSPNSQGTPEQEPALGADTSLFEHALSRQQSLSQQLSQVYPGFSSTKGQRPHHHPQNSSMGPLQSEGHLADAVASPSRAEGVPGLLLAGEAVVPTPAPVAADSLIQTAVEHQTKEPLQSDDSVVSCQPPPQAVQQQTSPVEAEAASHTAENGSKSRKAARQKASAVSPDSLGDAVTSSSSSRKASLPLPVLIAIGLTTAAAIASAVVYWVKRRSSTPAVAAEADDEFTRALKEMEAEEKAFDKEVAIEDDPGAELSAEEAALAMQQADAARKEKMIAAALAEGDAELAKIDALGSAELDNLDPDELAALEAELADLEGGEADAPLGAVA